MACSRSASAYRDAGVRAVIAPMLADKTLYQAYPGLIDAVPDALRADVLAFKLAPYRSDSRRRGENLRRLAVRSRLDSSRHRADHPAPLQRRVSRALPRSRAKPTNCRCRPISPRPRRRPCSALRKYGKTLTAHLDSLGMLGPHLSAAHAIWLDRDDLGRLADNGASVVHAPVSNMRFGSGLAHLRPMLDRGINVGVATDAANSSDQLNMFEATRLAALISRVQTPDFKSWLGPEEVLRMATVGSASAMAFDGTIGEIAPGYKADIVFLDLGQYQLRAVPRYR